MSDKKNKNDKRKEIHVPRAWEMSDSYDVDFGPQDKEAERIARERREIWMKYGPKRGEEKVWEHKKENRSF